LLKRAMDDSRGKGIDWDTKAARGKTLAAIRVSTGLSRERMGDQARIATSGVAGRAVVCSICKGLSGNRGLVVAGARAPGWAWAATSVAEAGTVPPARPPELRVPGDRVVAGRPPTVCSEVAGEVAPRSAAVLLTLKGEVPAAVANGPKRNRALELRPLSR